MKKMSDAVRELRKQKGLTQQQLANELGLAVSSVARYEAGKPIDPRVVALLHKLAEDAGLFEISNVFFSHYWSDNEDSVKRVLEFIWVDVVTARYRMLRNEPADTEALLGRIQTWCETAAPHLTEYLKEAVKMDDVDAIKYLERLTATNATGNLEPE
jgi:transcriptional regulator with XRE-family HTH domain